MHLEEQRRANETAAKTRVSESSLLHRKLQDLTRQVEDALTASDRRYQDLRDKLDDILWHLYPPGVSPGYRRLLSNHGPEGLGSTNGEAAQKEEEQQEQEEADEEAQGPFGTGLANETQATSSEEEAQGPFGTGLANETKATSGANETQATYSYDGYEEEEEAAEGGAEEEKANSYSGYQSQDQGEQQQPPRQPPQQASDPVAQSVPAPLVTISGPRVADPNSIIPKSAEMYLFLQADVSLPPDYTWDDLQTNSFAYSLEEIADRVEGMGGPGTGPPGKRRLLQSGEEFWEYLYGYYYGYDNDFAPSCTEGPFLTKNETSGGINTLVLSDIGVGASGITKTLRVVACLKLGLVSEQWDATFSLARPPLVESILTIPLFSNADFDTNAVDAVRTALGKLVFDTDSLAPADQSRVIINVSAIQAANVRKEQ